MAHKRHNEYSIALFGEGGVGKSSLVLYFVQEKGGHPDDDQLRYSQLDPTIEDSYRKQCVVDDEPCLLDILDTAGAYEYEAMWMSYIEKMALPGGFILVFSFTSAQSFHRLVRSP
jgi:GTPase KRas protein